MPHRVYEAAGKRIRLRCYRKDGTPAKRLAADARGRLLVDGMRSQSDPCLNIQITRSIYRHLQLHGKCVLTEIEP